MMQETDPNAEIDDRLRVAFRKEVFPATPRWEPIVRRPVDRRRSLLPWGIGVAAAALLTAGVIMWRQPADSMSVSVARSAPRQSESLPGDLAESSFLFTTPPVDALELLAHQQAAYVAVLQQMEME